MEDSEQAVCGIESIQTSFGGINSIRACKDEQRVKPAVAVVSQTVCSPEVMATRLSGSSLSDDVGMEEFLRQYWPTTPLG